MFGTGKMLGLQIPRERNGMRIRYRAMVAGCAGSNI
jgi:hypothetical protein